MPRCVKVDSKKVVGSNENPFFWHVLADNLKRTCAEAVQDEIAKLSSSLD